MLTTNDMAGGGGGGGMWIKDKGVCVWGGGGTKFYVVIYARSIIIL